MIGVGQLESARIGAHESRIDTVRLVAARTLILLIASISIAKRRYRPRVKSAPLGVCEDVPFLIDVDDLYRGRHRLVYVFLGLVLLRVSDFCERQQRDRDPER